MTTDQRLVRGARSRQAITRHAVDVASVEGLSGLTIGRLAADLGLSKSGVATLFRSKEQLQLATIDTAREAFLDAVVRPTAEAPPGLARLWALVERWITYIEQPLFPGGCFWTASIADFDSRPGPVRDALRDQRRAWLDRLATQLRDAIDADEITDRDCELAAFQLDAVLDAANTGLRLGEPDVTDLLRRAVRDIVA